MKRIAIVALFLTVSCVCAVWAEGTGEKEKDEATLENERNLAKKVLEQKDRTFLQATIENDANAWESHSSDEYYTNGLRLSYGRPIHSDGLFSRILDLWYPVDEPKAVLDQAVYEVAQNMYTPEDISRVEVDLNDRPYAGWTHLGVSLKRNDLIKKHYNTFGVSIGVLGDGGAAVAQKFVHSVGQGTLPRGWENHIENRLAFHAYFDLLGEWNPDYRCSFNKGETFGFSYFYNAHVEVGNVFDRVSVSPLVLRFGTFNMLDDIGSVSSIESKNEGTNTFESPLLRKSNWINASFFVWPKLFLIAYNGTLDSKDANQYDIFQVPIVLELRIGGDVRLFEHLYISYVPFNFRTLDFAKDYDVFQMFKEKSNFSHYIGELTVRLIL